MAHSFDRPLSLREIEVRHGPRNWCGVQGAPLVLFEAAWEEDTICPNLVYEPERRFVTVPGGWHLERAQYRELSTIADNRWRHLARTDEQRWWYLTAKLPGIAGCIYWVGAMSAGTPRFQYGGRTVNARTVPWSRNGRRTCGNSYCVRKEHAKGYFEAPADSFLELDWETRRFLQLTHEGFRVGESGMAAVIAALAEAQK